MNNTLKWDELEEVLSEDEDSFGLGGPLTESTSVSDARAKRDDEISQANLIQGLTQIGAGLAGKEVDSRPFDTAKAISQKRAEEVQGDALANRKLVAEFLKQRGKSAKDQNTEEWREKNYEQREREIRAKEEAASQKTEDKLNAPTDAEKSVDRDYGSHYNKWTQNGRNNAANAIKKLEALAAEMEQDTGLLQSGGGRGAAVLPEFFRSRDAIRRRDDTRNAANITLKEMFGGQLSDAEREAAAKEYYNDALDNEDNAKILRRKIGDLKDNFVSQEQKAKFYEDNRSLRNFRSAAPVTQKSEDSGGSDERAERRRARIQELKSKLGK